jgi:hypothetical protein
MGTELDLLIVENCIARKKLQNKKLISSYKDKYDLD